RGLQTAEAELVLASADRRPWEADRRRVATARQPVDHPPTGEPEAEHLRSLVEGLSGRVVAGGADPPVSSRPFCEIEARVPSRDEQGHVWKLDLALEENRQQMSL